MRKASKKLVAMVLAVLLLIPMLSVSAYADAPQAVLDAMKGVVCVFGWAVAEDGSITRAVGSGFVINNDKENVIVTNLHVVEGAILAKSTAGIDPEIDVFVGSDKPIPASILSYSDKDLAFITIPGSVSLEAISLRTDEVRQGETVYSVGYPFTADLMSNSTAFTYQDASITEGIISRRAEFTTSYGAIASIIQHSATINSGNSGGPLLDVNGNVIGINTWSVDISSGGQGTFGAIGAWELADFADDANISYSLVGKAPAAPAATPAPAPTTAPAPTPAPAPTAAPTAQPKEQSSAALPVWVWALIGVLAVALIAVIVILIVNKNKKKDPYQGQRTVGGTSGNTGGNGRVVNNINGQKSFHSAGEGELAHSTSRGGSGYGGGGVTIKGGGMSAGSAARGSVRSSAPATGADRQSTAKQGSLSVPDDL